MSPAKRQSTQLATADLDNPLYYLENMETVLGWVQSHHGDLLTAEELKELRGKQTGPSRKQYLRKKAESKKIQLENQKKI